MIGAARLCGWLALSSAPAGVPPEEEQALPPDRPPRLPAVRPAFGEAAQEPASLRRAPPLPALLSQMWRTSRGQQPRVLLVSGRDCPSQSLKCPDSEAAARRLASSPEAQWPRLGGHAAAGVRCAEPAQGQPAKGAAGVFAASHCSQVPPRGPVWKPDSGG